jgi:hypothetical protein
MSLHVGTGKAREVDSLLEAFSIGRIDPGFFCEFFLGRTLHDGQAEWMLSAEAKVNCLACSNRWGKTTLLACRHFHRGTYKIGAEYKYCDEDGSVNIDAFTSLKYETVHTAGEWEQAALVWEDAQKLRNENPRLQALISEYPRSKPPHMKGMNGWKWMFRTLGVNASNIDGKSIYYLSIDEAGWNDSLEEMLRNVLRVRTADVHGIIDVVGTFKPGISRDFYKIAVRASAYTGRSIGFAHSSEEEDDGGAASLDSAISKYLKEFGINIDEYRDALERGIHGS